MNGKNRTLRALLQPRSIAVIGASSDPGKLGHVLLKNVLDYGFEGTIYPVNPRTDRILDKRCYPAVKDIHSPVDLALVSIPGRFVLETVKDCAASGVKVLVILSSGFGEAGESGRKVQKEIRAISRESGMRVMGPNCMGIYNIYHKLNGTYFWKLPEEKGNVSFISQSGAYGGILFNEIRRRQIGIHTFVSIGNTADIAHADLLRMLKSDSNTAVIALFIEGIRDGRTFLEAAEEVTRVKPVVAFKAGRSEPGERAAYSHTGSIAGSYMVYKAAFRNCGILFEEDTDRFFDVITALANQKEYLPSTRNVAIMTISGGPSVTASDRCDETGLHLPLMDGGTREEIRALIPSFGADANPVDMTPQMNPVHYVRCVDTVMRDDSIGGVIAINAGLDVPQFGQAFVAAQKKYRKPVVAFTFDTPTITTLFTDADIPLLPTPERSVDAYLGLVRYGEYRKEIASRKAKKRFRSPGDGDSKDNTSPLVQEWKKHKLTLVPPHQGAQLLHEYGIPTVPHRIANTLDEATQWAESRGYPVALKISSSRIPHKTEAHALLLDITDAGRLSDSWRTLKEKFGPGEPVMIQKMLKGGIELLVGAKRDLSFGPVVLAGVGGIAAELYRDSSLEICPLTKGTAREMISRLRGYRLLEGYRRQKGYNVDLLAEIIVGVSRVILQNPSIAEIDLNPVILIEDRAAAVDTLFRLTPDNQLEI
jgi:acetyltransferase